MTGKRTMFLLAGTALTMLPGTTAAQETAADQTDASRPSPGDIVVTAQRREQSVKDIPFTVNAVGGDDLTNASVTDVFALQTQVPGLDIRTTNPPSAGGAFSLRGLGTGVFNLGFEPSVGTFIDGIYRARSGLVAGFDFLDLERVEVLKGPQGTLFGKNTTAGLINFVTAAPKFTTEGSMSAEYGNYNRMNVTGMFNTALSPSLAIRVAGSFTDDDGYIEDVASDRRYGEKHRWNVRGQLLFKPNDDLSIRIIGDYAKADESTIVPIRSANNPANLAFNQALATAIGSAYPNPPLASRWKTAINVDPMLNAEDWGVSAEINYTVGAVTLTSLSSYRSFTDAYLGDNDFVGTDILNTNQGDSAKAFTQELRLAGSAGPTDWIVGGFYGNEKIRRFNQFVWGSQIEQGLVGQFFGAVPGVAFTDDMGQDADSYGVFLHTISKLTDRFTLTAGVRYSWDKKSGFGVFDAPQSFPLPVVYDYGGDTAIPAEVDDSGLSGTASLAYDVTDQLSLYGTYSRGYKAGGISLIRDAAGVQAGFSPAGPPPGCTAVGGPVVTCPPQAPTFEKETVNHFEAGAKTSFGGGRATINVALFHTKVDNLQTQALQPSGTFLVVNIGSATARGVDMDLTLRPAPGLEFSGGMTYSKVTNQNGADIDHAPRFAGGAGTTYEFPLSSSGWSAFVHGDVALKDRYYTNNELTGLQGSYALANGRIGIRSPGDVWEVSAWCRNCFNTNYRTIDFTIPLDGAGLNDGSSVLSYLGEPRFYGATARVKF